MRKVAIYGKGGIGKSTTAQNLAAALAEAGARVLLVGCDPKADSTRLILGQRAPQTVLAAISAAGPDEVEPEDVVFTGASGIRCVEAGGPEPGVGCAGRGIITAINYLEDAEVFDEGFDYVIYDVLGDVVCGGFAMPIREGKAEEIYIVASGELMALYAANNICRGVARYAATGQARVAGIILNERQVEGEEAAVAALAARVNTQVTGTISRSSEIQRAELNRQTVVAFAPESQAAQAYRQLAAAIAGNTNFTIPTPMNEDEFDEYAAALA